MMEKRQRPASTGTQSLTVAPGANGIIATFLQDQSIEADVYMSGIGFSIDPVANQNFATFRLLLNGSPAPSPFGNMTSQYAPANDPSKERIPYLLGRAVKIELYGEMAAGAAGNTQMVGRVDLLLVPAGQEPRV